MRKNCLELPPQTDNIADFRKVKTSQVQVSILGRRYLICGLESIIIVENKLESINTCKCMGY